VVKRLKMSTLHTSGYNVKNVKIIHRWLKCKKCQDYIQVVKRLNMSKLYTSG